jgi:glycogen debranching enzyme
MYDEQSGLFRPLARPQPEEPTAVTWAALSPLALPDLPEAIGRRLVEEQLMDPGRFWLPVPPPSVSVSDPTFSIDDTGVLGIKRYWRGPTWINAAWLIWLGLIRLGYSEAAEELATRVGIAVRHAGLREYYAPYSGRGMGAIDFGWSSLVLEIVLPDSRAADSYLGLIERGSVKLPPARTR